jgi:hypothetical protein
MQSRTPPRTVTPITFLVPAAFPNQTCKDPTRQVRAVEAKVYDAMMRCEPITSQVQCAELLGSPVVDAPDNCRFQQDHPAGCLHEDKYKTGIWNQHGTGDCTTSISSNTSKATVFTRPDDTLNTSLRAPRNTVWPASECADTSYLDDLNCSVQSAAAYIELAGQDDYDNLLLGLDNAVLISAGPKGRLATPECDDSFMLSPVAMQVPRARRPSMLQTPLGGVSRRTPHLVQRMRL